MADAGGWLKQQVAQGQIVVIPVIEGVTGAQPARSIEVTVPDFTTSKRSLPPQSKVSDLSAYGRILEMLLRSVAYLPSETKQAFQSFISPATLKMTAGLFVAWAGSHLVGCGEAVDLALLGIGYALIGWSVFDAVASLSSGVSLALAATTGPDLDRAAEAFARGLTQLGINTLLLLLTRTRGGAAAAGEIDVAAIARWRIFIDGLELRFDGSRAALWSRLGDKGERAAMLARVEGRTTLESVLKGTGFFERYAAEFGAERTPETDKVTDVIWQMISEKYASQLNGRVTVYTDQLRLRGGAQPQLGAELLEILARPSVTSVVIKDVTNPSYSQVWTAVDIARARGAAPVSGLWN